MKTTQAIVQPNLFELKGFNTQITFSTTSILGVPQLNYTTRGKTLNFSGDELQIEQTGLGQMVTVDLTENPASEILETLTLLVPIVNLSTTAPEREIQTIAILSQIARSTKAQVQTYMTVYLAGKAKQVAF